MDILGGLPQDPAWNGFSWELVTHLPAETERGRREQPNATISAYHPPWLVPRMLIRVEGLEKLTTQCLQGPVLGDCGPKRRMAARFEPPSLKVHPGPFRRHRGPSVRCRDAGCSGSIASPPRTGCTDSPPRTDPAASSPRTGYRDWPLHMDCRDWLPRAGCTGLPPHTGCSPLPLGRVSWTPPAP